VFPATVLWSLIGLFGLIYTAIVARRMRVQTTYQPELEDWIFHFLLPLMAYVILLVSALASLIYVRDALFGIGTAALLLLFIGIHNA
jgi:hypothetical protein